MPAAVAPPDLLPPRNPGAGVCVNMWIIFIVVSLYAGMNNRSIGEHLPPSNAPDRADSDVGGVHFLGGVLFCFF